MRTIVFIVGMHRSGTSALAGCLVQLGYPLPQDPMLGTVHNPKGYFESNAIRHANDRALAAIGRNWSDCRPPDLSALPDKEAILCDLEQTLLAEFPQADKIALKDPRISLLLPLWLEICERQNYAAKIILMRRHPEEVAASLNRRDNMPFATGYYLWSRYTLEAERHSRGTSRLRVDSKALMQAPEATLSQVVEFLGDDSARENLAAGQLDGFVQPDLLQVPDCPDIPARQDADGIFNALDQIGQLDAPDCDRKIAQLNAYHQALAGSSHALHDLSTDLRKDLSRLQDSLKSFKDFRAKHAELGKQRDELKAQYAQTLKQCDEAITKHGTLNNRHDALTEKWETTQAAYEQTQSKLDLALLQLQACEQHIQHLSESLEDCRKNPFATLSENLSYRVLISLSKMDKILPGSTRETLKNTAKPKSPRRDSLKNRQPFGAIETLK
ncbi:MAG: sulfotransferase [Mangrovicoccus sp.]|nr:sulfotransferase [Mangrovicoccus sp.]